MTKINQQRIIANFNLGGLAADIASVRIAETLAKINRLKPNPYNIPGQTPIKNKLYSSDLGTPVFSNLQIDMGRYIDNKGNTIDYEGCVIDTVLITAQQTKNIIVTPIQGQNGTIKEYISDGDWHINIKGILLGKNNTYPQSDVDNLQKILKAPASLVVNGFYLNQLGIFNLVITDYILPQKRGGYSEQDFEFNAISDQPIELF